MTWKPLDEWTPMDLHQLNVDKYNQSIEHVEELARELRQYLGSLTEEELYGSKSREARRARQQLEDCELELPRMIFQRDWHQRQLSSSSTVPNYFG